MEYIIVRIEWPQGATNLAEKVQSKIEEGFEPLGGMTTWEDKLRGRVFAQSMVRRENTWEEDNVPETVGDKFIRGFMGRGRSNES